MVVLVSGLVLPLVDEYHEAHVTGVDEKLVHQIDEQRVRFFEVLLDAVRAGLYDRVVDTRQFGQKQCGRDVPLPADDSVVDVDSECLHGQVNAVLRLGPLMRYANYNLLVIDEYNKSQ